MPLFTLRLPSPKARHYKRVRHAVPSKTALRPHSLLLLMDTLSSNEHTCLLLYLYSSLSLPQVSIAMQVPLRDVQRFYKAGLNRLYHAYCSLAPSAVPRAIFIKEAVPVLAQVLRADCDSLVTPQMVARSLQQATRNYNHSPLN